MSRHLSACRDKLLSALPVLTPAQYATRKVIDHFETLGDNCEFGFVQRRVGDRDGGLLRWAFSPPHALTAALEDRFSRLYRFDDLTPSGPRMVHDAAYGLAFHSAMTSRDGDWTQDDATRRKIHATESRKYHYLRQKLLDRLADPKRVFVYKTNPPNRATACPELIKTFNTTARATLLLVETTPDPALFGTVHADRLPGCLVGYLDRFAPYDNARAISRHWWSIVPRAAAIRQEIILPT